MKNTFIRAIILVLSVCVLLCACSDATPVPSTTDEPTTATTVPAATTVTTTATTAATTSAPDPTEPPIDSDFLAGFGRVDISPEDSVPLRGYGNTSKRMSTYIQDPLYATCIALEDGTGNTVLLFALDLTSSEDRTITSARKLISDSTGIPMDNIMVSCSHNHSSPDIYNTEKQSILQYIQSLKSWMLEAARLALEDMSPAKMHVSSVQVTGLNFVRRYVLENGTYAGDNYGDFNSAPIAGHESEVDNELQLITLERANAKDIILANFQTHPHRAGGSQKTGVTSDLIGPFRDKLEEDLDCQVAYFTGGSGNVNPTSRISGETATADYIEHGKRLATYAKVALKKAIEIETGNIQTTKTTYVGQVNHSQDHLLEVAKKIQKEWTTTGSYSSCVSMGKPYGINSPYHANAIVTKYGMPKTQSFEIYALSVGDIAFVAAPYEMFDSNGKEIKDGSPFDMTFVMTCANTSQGYIPSALGWKNGGYSVDTTRWAAGTAENLVANYLTMLNQLYVAE